MHHAHQNQTDLNEGYPKVHVQIPFEFVVDSESNIQNLFESAEHELDNVGYLVFLLSMPIPI